jgi:hypothetical protein
MANDVFFAANGKEALRLFAGEVNTVEHTLTRPQRSLQVRALGRFSILLDKRPQTTQLYESTPTVPFRVSDAITVLLDAIGWDPAMRVIDEADTILTYWWMDGSQDGLTILNQLLAAEGAGGCAYEQAGVFHFEGRQFRFNNPRSTDDQWIIGGGFLANPSANAAEVPTNDANTFANGLTDVTILFDTTPTEYRSNPDEVISAATLTINHRAPFPDQDPPGDPPEVARVWEYGGLLALPAGISVIEGVTKEPYKQAHMLDLGGDYTVFSGTLVAPPVLLSMSGTLVRIQWNAGPGGAVIFGGAGGSDGPQLRAVSLPVRSESVIRSTVDTSVAAARYQPREHAMDAWPEIERGQALDIVNSMALRYQAERRQATLRIVNVDAAHMNAIMHIRVSDRIRWYQQHGAINEPYWVEQISHEIAPGGGLHTVTLGVERVFDRVGGRFDSAVFGSAGPPPSGTGVFGE